MSVPWSQIETRPAEAHGLPRVSRREGSGARMCEGPGLLTWKPTASEPLFLAGGCPGAPVPLRGLVQAARDGHNELCPGALWLRALTVRRDCRHCLGTESRGRKRGLHPLLCGDALPTSGTEQVPGGVSPRGDRSEVCAQCSAAPCRTPGSSHPQWVGADVPPEGLSDSELPPFSQRICAPALPTPPGHWIPEPALKRADSGPEP